ncbi:nucleotide exchange factor GrpE [Candidatus Uhrbacteria bacterium]|jgi:molecular chaperone GrpE|nr:nucleotide exchange factor GrpE [Candidatus Uhrbacteria bacterium]MBT7717226.1 nucleotide exchange factor GrpE [Candidatus Uhrbacteria bacterium]
MKKKDKSEKLKDESKKISHSVRDGETSECEKCVEYLSGWKRALADYENMKADIDKTKSYNRDQIKIELVFNLLPVMDNFDQAVNHAPDVSKDKSLETWLQGVTFIKKQFEDVLDEMGLEKIDTSIEFDLSLHEAVEEREEEDRSPSEIIEVQQTGWKIGERVLRPAKVIVNKLK